MKNIFALFAVTFLFAIIFSSCKKQTITNTIYIKDTTIHLPVSVTDTVNGRKIIGYWPGAYENPGYYPDQQFSFLFRSNGTVRVYIYGTDSSNALFTGEGQYQVTDSIVVTKLNIGSNLYSTIDTIRFNGYIFMEGTIGQGLNTSGFGVNIAHKQ
jgi:hypothetical protein